MSQKNIINLLTGASQVVRKSANILKSKGSHLVEEEILRGNYVSREEFNQLKKLIDKIQKEITTLKQK